MAVHFIPIPPDPKRDARARELVKSMHTWSTGTLKQAWGSFERGTAYFITPCGYQVNAVFCSCPDYIRGGNICKHIRAVALKDRQQQAPKPRPTYENLHPTCQAKGCDSDPETRERFCWRHVVVDAF
jgi:hypothetical protein